MLQFRLQIVRDLNDAELLDDAEAEFVEAAIASHRPFIEDAFPEFAVSGDSGRLARAITGELNSNEGLCRASQAFYARDADPSRIQSVAIQTGFNPRIGSCLVWRTRTACRITGSGRSRRSSATGTKSPWPPSTCSTRTATGTS